MVSENLYELDVEEEEKILKDVGVKDLVELMKCKNCLELETKKGKLYCKLHDKPTESNQTCSGWNENLKTKGELKETYDIIIEILKEFIDVKEEYYVVLALWIIGTYFHDEFETYPYLFVNAMRGSGKTRLLKLIKEMSWKGDMLASLSEAVLFRTEGTLCIDEFENIGRKEKNNLRELLNTAYKKGGKVKRMKKRTTKEGEEQIVEEFDTFRPIVMANIWGIEEVLGDRCITIILEKSSNNRITRKIENFHNYTKIKRIRRSFHTQNPENSVVRCNVETPAKVYREWNRYVDTYITTHNNTHTPNTHNNTLHLFDKIYQTNINGRELELTFPLFIVAEEIGILDQTIDIMKKIIIEKKAEDIMEGRDIMVYNFITKQFPKEWHKMKELTNIFRNQVDYDSEEENWCNTKWMGKALKRLNLILSKRRQSYGIEIILDIDKAKEKMEIFDPKNE